MKCLCAICGKEITKENDSEEHVIPQSVGGKLVITGFLCAGCNSKAGEKCDAALAKQLNPLSLFFGIVRERGKVPPQVFKTTTGDKLQQHADGSFSPAKPSYHEEKTEEGIEIKISARSDEELNKILAGIKKKYPKVDIETLKQEAVRVRQYPKGLILNSLEFGGHETGKSIVKTALAFASNVGVAPSVCTTALEYLKGCLGEAPFGYYSKDIVLNRPAGIPLHCVAIAGNPEEKLLLGYVEYYGFRRMMICLSDQYLGEKFSNAYAINPVTGETIDLRVAISLQENKIPALFNGELYSAQETKKALSDVVGPRLQQTQEAERKRVIDEAIDLAVKKSGCGEGECFTEEHIKKMSLEIVERITPYILHLKNL